MFLANSFCKRPVHQLSCVLSAFKQCKQERLFFDSSSKDENLYRILGVSPNATQTEIKDAYYNLTLKFHPDRNDGSPEAALKFHQITEAYEIIGNYFLRKRYDKGMPLPTRYEAPTADTGVPHVVKYQQFFDARNLPYQPSAYAAGGGARKFDEYHAKQFAQVQGRPLFDDDREYREECERKKTPSMIALVLLLWLTRRVAQEFELAGPGPRSEVEHYEFTYPYKFEYRTPRPDVPLL